MCSPPSPPRLRAPRVSPLPVTIRRNVVAGSMTPWAEARLSAPRSWRLPAARAGGRATCRAGRAGARRCPHAPLRCRGSRVGRGGEGHPPGTPPPRRARRPAPAHRRHPHRAPPPATPRPGTAGVAFRLCPHGRGSALLVLTALWWGPRDLVDSSPLQTCPFPSRCAGGCGDADERKVGNQ